MPGLCPHSIQRNIVPAAKKPSSGTVASHCTSSRRCGQRQGMANSAAQVTISAG